MAPRARPVADPSSGDGPAWTFRGPLAPGSRRRLLLTWLGLGVTVLFAYLAVRNVDAGEALEALRDADPWWLLPAFAVLALAIVVRAWRWRVLFPPGTRPPYRPLLGAVLIGYFFNSILPARAGEAARIVVLHRSTRASWVESAATALVERALDLLTLLVLFLVAYPWLPEVRWFRAVAALAALLVAGFVGAAVVLALFGERPVRYLVRPLRRTRLSEGRLEAAVLSAGRGLAGLRRLDVFAPAIAWTAVSWVLLVLSNWLAMLSFDFGLSPLAGLLVAVATGVGMVLPSSPASLGVFEAAVVVALSAYDVPESEAISYAVLLHLLNLVPFLVAGPIALRQLERGRRPARPAPEAEL